MYLNVKTMHGSRWYKARCGRSLVPQVSCTEAEEAKFDYTSATKYCQVSRVYRKNIKGRETTSYLCSNLHDSELWSNSVRGICQFLEKIKIKDMTALAYKLRG